MRWVARQRIPVNRAATCWLIQRFLDPKAKFLFVPAENVAYFRREPGHRFRRSGRDLRSPGRGGLMFFCGAGE